MRSSTSSVAVLVILGLAGCGGAHPEPVRGRSQRAVAPPAADEPATPRFSVRELGADLSLLGLHYAHATALRALPSSDVVLIGCSEGPTDLRPDTEPTRVLGFVARVDPRAGTVRWARHLELASAGFENRCYAHYRPTDPGPEVVATTQLAVAEDGGIFVAAFTDDPAPRAPVSPEVPAGAVVLALHPEDGSTRWVQQLAPPSELSAVTTLVAEEGGGVVALVRRFAGDGQDTHTLLDLDADGHRTERATLRVAPMPGRRTPCYRGANGCGVAVEWLASTEDGSLLMVGAFGGVELTLGDISVRSEPDAAHYDGFVAVVDPRGAPQVLRSFPYVLTALARAHGEVIVATAHSRSHEERAEQIDLRSGRTSAWSGAADDPAWPLASLLRWDATRRERWVGGTITRPNETHELAPAPETRPALVDRLARLDPSGPAPELVALPDGHFVARLDLIGALRIGDRHLESAVRMVSCHPGPAGEEVTLPPDCRERLERPTAVLVVY